MKKIINAPETYVDDMLKGIYAAHPDQVNVQKMILEVIALHTKKKERSLLLLVEDPDIFRCFLVM